MLTRFKNIPMRLSPLVLLFVLVAANAYADAETPEWVNLYSYTTTLNGSPIPVGALVDAYDSNDVHCGRYIVDVEGRYGFLAVLADDDLTPDEDEGADPGEEIELRINGVTATPLGPETAVWTSNGQSIEVDLAVEYFIDVDVRSPKDAPGTPSQYTNYLFWVINSGEGIDFFNLEVWSEHGWSAELLVPGTTDYIASGDSTQVAVRVLVPGGAADGDTDDLTLTATSAMDASVSESGVVTTIVGASAADGHDGLVPGVFKLFQNFPNPFNPSTRIEFSLERGCDVRLEVFNVLGQRTRLLLDGWMPGGSHEIEWDGTTESGLKTSSGIYFYKLSTGQYSRTMKMLLMK